MVEISKKTIGGIITIVMMLTGSGAYLIQDAGTKTGCRAGWILEEIGEYEGYYKCITTTNVRYEMCFEVYNSSNTENYWCKKGLLIEQEEEPEPQQAKPSGKREICTLAKYGGCS